MRFVAILIALTLISCLDHTTDKTIATLTLQETAQKLTGYWQLKSVESSTGRIQPDLDLKQLKYFEFDQLKGFEVTLTDVREGSFQKSSNEPTCELTERGSKKIIKYSTLIATWENEIKSISQNELVLADSSTAWTYSRYEVD